MAKRVDVQLAPRYTGALDSGLGDQFVEAVERAPIGPADRLAAGPQEDESVAVEEVAVKGLQLLEVACHGGHQGNPQRLPVLGRRCAEAEGAGLCDGVVVCPSRGNQLCPPCAAQQ